MDGGLSTHDADEYRQLLLIVGCMRRGTVLLRTGWVEVRYLTHSLQRQKTQFSQDGVKQAVGNRLWVRLSISASPVRSSGSLSIRLLRANLVPPEHGRRTPRIGGWWQHRYQHPDNWTGSS